VFTLAAMTNMSRISPASNRPEVALAQPEHHLSVSARLRVYSSLYFATQPAVANFGSELVTGGWFTFAGGELSAYFARWSDTGLPWFAATISAGRLGLSTGHPSPVPLPHPPKQGGVSAFARQL
jgi:hypothetical protein